jgi:hypothetical protein
MHRQLPGFWQPRQSAFGASKGIQSVRHVLLANSLQSVQESRHHAGIIGRIHALVDEPGAEEDICLHGWKKLRPTIQLEARWPKSLFLAPAKARLIITTGGQIGHQGIRTMNDPRNESHLCNGVMQDEALGLTVLDGVVNLVQLRRLITVQTRRFGTAV